MLKKILIGLIIVILFSYVGFIQYENLNYGSILNKLTKEKVLLDANYHKIKNEVSNLNKNINDTNKEEATIQEQVNTKGLGLTKINDEIKAKQTEISKRRQAQAKQNIINNFGSKVAYLTFDDGPSGYTSRVLDILKEYNIKATFFVNGRSDEYSYNIYRRIVNEGHSIGNHGYSHNYQINYSSVNAFDNNFNQLQNTIQSVTGVTPNIMRFPGGSNNTISNNYSYGIMDTLTNRYRDLGYKYFDWNVTAADTAVGANNTTVINNILNGCKSRSYVIMLMHDSHATTPSTLESIIVSLSNSGFKFLPLTIDSYAIQFK
jgi:peptidoglycan/xylan/chitin deacetylase (PgdA/CDA1 family)